MFQKAIGEQNLEYQLTKLAQDPKIQESIRNMNAVIDSGQRGDYEAGDFYHNIQIDRIMNAARKKAWASIMNDPQVQEVMKEQKEAKRAKVIKMRDTTNILNMYK